MDKKLIIFDFDGTLADSLDAWWEIDKLFFGKRNINFTIDIPNFQGMSLTEAAIYVKERYSFPESVEEIKKEWVDLGYDLYVNQVKPKPFARECLELAKEKGYHTAIGSSNGKDIILPFLENNNLDNLVDFVLTSCEVGKGKPNPDIFLKIAEHFNISPSNSVVFEDTIEGINAGKNANMKVYTINEPHHKDFEDKIKEISTNYINSFEEILLKGDF